MIITSSGVSSIGDVPGLQTALDGKESLANKDQPNGYAGLDGAGKYPGPLQLVQITEPENAALKLEDGTLTYDGESLYIHDGEHFGGRQLIPVDLALLAADSATALQNPPECLRIVARNPTSNVTFTVRSTTGYVCLVDQEGTVSFGGTGNPASDITLSLTAITSGTWRHSAPKTWHLFSCTDANATQSGYLTKYTSSTDGACQVFASNLSQLSTLFSDAATATWVNCPALTTLNAQGHATLDLLRYPALTSLTFSGTTSVFHLRDNPLTSLGVTLTAGPRNLVIENKPDLTTLTLAAPLPSNITVSGCAALTDVQVSSLTGGGTGGSVVLDNLPALSMLQLQGLACHVKLPSTTAPLYYFFVSPDPPTSLDLSEANLARIYLYGGASATPIDISGWPTLLPLLTLGFSGAESTGLLLPDGVQFTGSAALYLESIHHFDTTAWDALWTALGPATTPGQTITYFSCTDLTASNTSLATAKGYTIQED